MLVYLSQLFLARVYVDGGRFADGERAYRAALAAHPGTQAAVLGLAELQARRDGIAATRPLVADAVAYAPAKGRARPVLGLRRRVRRRGGEGARRAAGGGVAVRRTIVVLAAALVADGARAQAPSSSRRGSRACTSTPS